MEYTNFMRFHQVNNLQELVMDIFVSRPTWVSDEFEDGLESFYIALGMLGLNPRTLGVNDFAIISPLDEVIKILNKCKGAIILGYPQIKVQKGELKDKEILEPFDLGTEWNHIEAGLAYSKGLPLLIIHHESVKRGIFELGALNLYIHKVNLAQSDWAMNPAVNGAILNWKNLCI